MQRNPFYGTELQNPTPFIPYHLPSQNIGPSYPEIIGEGEVTSVVFPNGSIQYIFIPTHKRDPWSAYVYNPNSINSNRNQTNEAWFVRNIPNPMPYCFSQEFQRAYGDPFITSCFPSDFNPNFSPLGFHNKFHNDNWTSTTDLHYFYPNLRYLNQPEKSTASVQIDTPVRNTVCHYEVVCGKPCHCGSLNEKVKFANEKNSDQVECCMSVEEVKDRVQSEHSHSKVGANKVKTQTRDNSYCDCSSNARTSDKIISTYNDQASGSFESLNRTQERNKSTVGSKIDCNCNIKKHKKVVKKPVRNKCSPIKITGICESGCCCRGSSITTEEEI
ncbi:unnamed protein product [Parnassius apollo]|uniref:(apollo) hypothetical protein n=1 Tax=Parnassius apollo TaxID=110799 RepID=A0A8S3WKT9_PARAO|nr:unnamed protein product [Parnassius apollo]